MKFNNHSLQNNFTKYSRRKSSEVSIGEIFIGGKNSIMVQSMATVDTNHIEEATNQAKRIFDAGAMAVRFTAQGVREASALRQIRENLTGLGVRLPLIADIHFNQKAAFEAARNVEKVRINPGNFIDKRNDSENIEYSETEYADELERLEEVLVLFFEECNKNNTAVRIGVNHGSLSERVMSVYGDTELGMTISAMEFLKICQKHDFKNVVVSMKSSNPVTMVIAYRMLCEAMQEKNMSYPLHLGVTEAGEGNDARVRSAVGIGALLNDGIGDTLRVSLTEEPEDEIPVARLLVDYYHSRKVDFNAECVDFSTYNPYSTNRTKQGLTKVVFDVSCFDNNIEDLLNSYPEDFVYIGKRDCGIENERILRESDQRLCYATLESLTANEIDKDKILVIESTSPQYHRAVSLYIMQNSIPNTVVLKRSYDTSSIDELMVWSAADLGGLLIDGFGDAIWVSSPILECFEMLPLSILQSSRRRISKAEYISCPGCGRTLFNLQSVVKEVKERTTELKNIKIAIMGCIVNGPGEMADADYGYVGAGKGRVTLYKQKKIIEQNIPEEIAIDRLIELIKINGDWK